MTRRVLLAGEGKTELGDWVVHPSFRDKKPLPGVLEALLHKVAPQGWEIRHAIVWKQLTRYRANEPGLGKDELNTRALWLRAVEHDCDLIVFSRDRDRAVERGEAVEKGRKWLDDKCADSSLRVIGGMAHECIEAWVLAMSEQRRTEDLPSAGAKQQLVQRGVTDLAAMVNAIGAAALARVPNDARSLLAWLPQAQKVFAAPGSPGI
jgi:hypothetical protein